MAATDRKKSTDISAARLSSVKKLSNGSLFKLVRLLERYNVYDSDNEPHSRIGSDSTPVQEAVRFHTVNHMGFSSNEVENILQRTGILGACDVYDIDVGSMGLTGPTGVLPQHYTRQVQQRIKQHDYALADFLDMFNHRLISLLYRAWAKYRLTVDFEDHQSQGKQSPATRAIQSLAGQYSGLYYETPLYFAGHFARQTRSASSLQTLLQDYLQHPVSLESFMGRWLQIGKKDRLCIGSNGFGRNNRLGDGVLPGNRVWDVQSKCQINIGPITYAEHERLLPDTSEFKELETLIRSYVPAHLLIELHFIIEDETKNTQKPLGNSLRLGWNTWLNSQKEQKRQATVWLN